MTPDNDEGLAEFVAKIVGEKVSRVEADLGHGFVRLKISEADKRQAKHDIRSVEGALIELLRNSRDAGAKRIFVATARTSSGLRSLTVIDDGRGVPSDLDRLIFEPRVTSRLSGVTDDRWGVHGRGMALFAITTVSESATLQASEVGLGTSIRVECDTARLHEKKDQSTFPKVEREKTNTITLRGVGNLPWVVSRFALDHPEIDVYLGSYAEVASAMVIVGRKLSVGHLQLTPLWLRIAQGRGASEIDRILLELFGEQLSERTVQRIISGETRPAVNVRELLEGSLADRLINKAKAPLTGSGKGLSKRFSDEDLQAFAQAIGENFRHLAKKYFVKSVGVPEVQRRDSSLNVAINVIEDDEQQ